MIVTPTVKERACNPKHAIWEDLEGYSCQDHKNERWCNSDGSFGPEWIASWGPFSNLADDDGMNALNCPQCGCIANAMNKYAPAQIEQESTRLLSN